MIEYGLVPEPQGADADLNDVELNYFAKGGVFYLVELDKKYIGCCGLFPLTENSCELRKMYLLKDYRGQGIGQAILEYSIEKASELRFEKIYLETFTSLKEAISLYKKFSFQEIDRNKATSRCNMAFVLNLKKE